MVSIAAAFVAMRFIFKGTMSRLEFGYDDWCVLATLIAATPSAIITVIGTVKNGLGRDLWTLTPDEITNMLRYFYIMAWLYFTQLTLLKLTLLFFYIRVFPAKPVQRLLWGNHHLHSPLGHRFHHRCHIPMSAHQLLLDKMGWDAPRHMFENQRHHRIQRRHLHRFGFLDLRCTPLAALGSEAALEEEDWRRNDVLRRHLRHGRQYSASAGFSALCRFFKRKLGVLRCLGMEHS
jgi:hypothetical protein